MNHSSALLAAGLLLAASAGSLHGQTPPTLAAGASTASEPLNWTTQQDHRNMMDQLGIKRLRPGPSGQPGATNSANYDPAKANPFPNLPDPLTLKNGRKVTTAGMWWKERRPEIVEDFEREVFGRVPKNVPKVTWMITTQATDRVVGGLPVNARQLIGKVDSSACPSIEVNIQMTLVTPAKAGPPVPVLMMFGGFFGGNGLPRRAGEPEPTNRFRGFGNVTFADPPSTEQLIAAGWGYAIISPNSIQPDNGAGLTKGIIGLVNKGQPRKPDDWGALRAWAWGAARGLDCLETDPTVDAKKVGIEGVSRYGKAALVTLAFEPRFALALVGSSGEGGAKLHRRNFGEAVENLTGSGGYHWMAGNFLKYGAAEPTYKNAGDLPVDAHQLIALCAPRPTFISYGIPEKGDANWLDQQGSFMATVAAGPVFRLLGVRDLGVTEDYRTAPKPPVNTSLLDGELAWRQHDGGHEDRSNMKHFIAWANKLIKHTPPAPTESK
ncbi:MAG: acetylxylan esterase [Verrucomicrobia bacterium]|nr:acetylxylan esterase [Verrucomicrobiota bacterium]